MLIDMDIRKRFRRAVGDQVMIEKKVKRILTAHGSPPRFNHFYMNFGKKLAQLQRNHKGGTFVLEACAEAAKWLTRELDFYILQDIMDMYMAGVCAPSNASYVVVTVEHDLPNSILGDGRYLKLDGSNKPISDYSWTTSLTTNKTVQAEQLTSTDDATIGNKTTTRTLQITAPGSNNYLFRERGEFDLALQSQSTAKGFLFKTFTKDGDGTNIMTMSFLPYCPQGPDNLSDREVMNWRWHQVDHIFQITISAAGTGTQRPFRIETSSNANQFRLETDGGIKMCTLKSGATQVAAGAATNELWVTSGHATLPDNVVMRGV